MRGWRATTLGSLVGIAVLLGIPVLAAAESVTIAWDANPEQDLAGYKVHIGTKPGTYTQTIDVGHVVLGSKLYRIGVKALHLTLSSPVAAATKRFVQAGSLAEPNVSPPGTRSPPASRLPGRRLPVR